MIRWAAVLAAGMPTLALPALADAAPDLAEGQAVYQEACAGCHGPEGHGDGDSAALLSGPVADLTRYAARNGGRFDAVRMIWLIDGREGLAAHGGPMPMFGGLLAGPAVVIDAPDGSPVATTAPILAVVRWLETIQETGND